MPKNDPGAKRFEFRVVDPAAEIRLADVFTDARFRDHASAIGELWRAACAPKLEPFKPGEAEWSFLSMDAASCRQLVDERWTSGLASKTELRETCARLTQ